MTLEKLTTQTHRENFLILISVEFHSQIMAGGQVVSLLFFSYFPSRISYSYKQSDKKIQIEYVQDPKILKFKSYRKENMLNSC